MTFVDFVTPVPADWLNNVNFVVNNQITPTTPSLVVANIAALRNVIHLNNTSVTVLGYTNKGDGGGGAYYYNASDTSSADNGGTIIVAVDGARWYATNQTIITPQMFGCVSGGSSNEQTQFQTAIDYAYNNGKYFLAAGTFLVDHITLSGYNGFKAHLACNLVASTAGTVRSALFEIFNGNNIYITGSCDINTGYQTNYTQGILVWGTATCQYIRLENFSVNGAQQAWTFGSLAHPDALISEITIAGGQTFGCPSVCQVIGVEAFISVSQPIWSADTFGGSGAWLTLPAVGTNCIGGRLEISGGELLMTAITTGVLCQTQCLQSTSFQNRYGTIVCRGLEIETASKLAQAVNSQGVAVPFAGLGDLHFVDCDGFTSFDNDVFIFTDALYSGRITLKNNNFYFLSGNRTHNNIQCGNTAAVVYTDPISLGLGFKDWIGGVIGGTVKFDGQSVLDAQNLNSQNFPASTNTNMVFVSANNTGPNIRFLPNYSAVSGLFTVPAGGLKALNITVSAQVSGVTAGQIEIYITGVLFAAAPFVNGVGNVSLGLNSLPSGATINAAILTTAGSGNANATSTAHHFSITASC